MNRDKRYKKHTQPFFRVKRIYPSLGKKKSEIHHQLENIYKDRNGNIPNMSRLERKKHNPFTIFFIFFIIVLILLLGASWGSFYFFSDKSSGFTGDRVSVFIDGPDEIASGDAIEYRIKYINDENVPLRQSELTLTVPDGFRFISSSPSLTKEDAYIWDFGTLVSGYHGELVVKGSFIGKIDQEKTISATLSYWPEGFNSEFDKVASKTSKIVSSLVTLKIDGQEKVIGDAETEFVITYENISDMPLDSVKITAIYPKGFIASELEPEPNRQNNVWMVDELDSNKEGIIRVHGKFSKDSSAGSNELLVRLEIQDENGQYQLQQEEIFTIALIKDLLQLNLIINGSTEDQEVAFGDKLNYTVVFKNNGDIDIEDLTLKLPLSDLIDPFSLVSEDGGEIQNGILVFSPSDLDKLKKVAPSSEGVINFSINIISNPEESLSLDFSLKSKVEASFKGIGDMVVDSNEIIIGINSSVNFSTIGQYYDSDGTPVGSGPLPPEVGKETIYQIVWRLDNSIHELKDIVVSTTIPDNVIWKNKYVFKTGDLNYDSSDRTVKWSIARVPAQVTNIEAKFFVSIVPTEEDVSKILILIPKTEFQAVDVVTGHTVELEGKMVTTTLEDDELAHGKGVVVDSVEGDE